MLNKIKRTLRNYYLQPLNKTYKKFRNGAIYFSVGLITFYLSNLYLSESLLQELIVLIALILCSIGFLIAMLAQTRIIISRFVKFYSKKDIKSKPSI